MSRQKSKKTSPWFQCEKCHTYLLSKDIENHHGFCPPNMKNIQHTFVLNGVLHGILDLKPTEDVKNLNTRDKSGLVFVSQGAMQLCSFSIGENVVVESIDEKVSPLVQKVWPTNEKSLTSVLVTRNCLGNNNLTECDVVTVRKLPNTNLTASQIALVILNGPESLEISPQLGNRISKSYLNQYLTQGNILNVMYYGSLLKFEVKAIETRNDIEKDFEGLSLGDYKTKFYFVDNYTKWKIYSNQQRFVQDTNDIETYQIAGLDSEVAEIQELLNACIKKPDDINFMQSKSVLLYGNSGTGKTTIAKMLALESQAYTVEIYAPDLYSKHSGSPEDVIKEMFQNAKDNSPSVVILDEVDLLCQSRNGRLTDSEKRIVSTMLTCLDESNQNKFSRVFIIGTTNKIDNIDPAFRRYGRLDREIEIPTPNPKSRKAILQKLLSDTSQNLSGSDFHEISITTHGFVGADLISLCSQASLLCRRRNGGVIELHDFKMALRTVRPSAMREVQIEVPNVKWSDIGGQDNLKLILKQAVEWPLKYPDSFIRLGVTPPKGVLMYGPPGCSKTMIAKALATESGLNFLSIKGPELFSKWVGESEKAIREVFRKARQVAPSVVFFDEIDALGGERGSGSSTSVQERVLAQLLTELDGITPLGDVTILAATNRPDRIDKALLRPGRLDRIVYVPLPDENTRREIFRIKLSKMPTKNVHIDDIVAKTHNYSGAEVNAVCHEAAMMALEENLQSEYIEERHFEKALKLVTPRTPKSLIKLYEDYINLKI